jgi:hypothetical protein
MPVHICTTSTPKENMSIFGVYRPVSTCRASTASGRMEQGKGGQTSGPWACLWRG